MPSRPRKPRTNEATDNLLSIRKVARQSGLTPQTIHIWEKQYEVVDPRRTHANRLVYSEADVYRLTLLGRATQAGHRISDIANLSITRLEKLVAGGRKARRVHNITR